MTGEEFVTQEKDAAEAAGISSKRADAPIYDRDAEPEKVTLPPGWKPSSLRIWISVLWKRKGTSTKP